MKCLCGFQHLPNSAPLLANHLQDCMLDGAFTDPAVLPVIVWRDGGFAAVRQAEEGEQTFEIGLTRPAHELVDVEDVAADIAEPVVEEETDASE